MRKITIAIDGFSSTGKSTIAKQLAKALGYVYVDTGAMYRAVTLYALDNGFIEEKKVDAAKLIAELPQIEVKFVYNDVLGFAEVYLNGINVEGEIRKMRISTRVSRVAMIAEVRTKLVELQQAMGTEKAIVMDGRDIGSVVFPDAELKLFLTASPEARAARRYKELLDRGDEVTYEEVLINVRERDYIDANREISPLLKTDDAIEIDNSDMGLKEQFERIHSFSMRIIEKQ